MTYDNSNHTLSFLNYPPNKKKKLSSIMDGEFIGKAKQLEQKV